MSELTQDLVRELFDYRDGELYWNVYRGSRAKIGDLAGSIPKDGYRSIKIYGKAYFAHRLIFLYHHGYLPDFLDHIDMNPLNNNISNIREATWSQNGMNQKKQKSHCSKPTSSKYKGVTWYKQLNKWMCQIQISGKKKHLGYFKSEMDAAKAYDDSAVELHGKFAKLNFDKDHVNE